VTDFELVITRYADARWSPYPDPSPNVRNAERELRNLLGQALSHLQYHREEFGCLKFDDPDVVDRIRAALETP